jgi:hypothetical protein
MTYRPSRRAVGVLLLILPLVLRLKLLSSLRVIDMNCRQLGELASGREGAGVGAGS